MAATISFDASIENVIPFPLNPMTEKALWKTGNFTNGRHTVRADSKTFGPRKFRTAIEPREHLA